MNTMKIAMAMLLGSLGSQAFAQTAPTPDPAAEQYDYSTRLDVAHVVSITEPANECAPVPVQMTYEDSQGQRHVLQYQIMGTGCSN